VAIIGTSGLPLPPMTSSDFNALIELRLLLRADHPELLNGLDQLLQKGLISDRQIRQLALQQLTCQATPAAQPTAQPADRPTAQPADRPTAQPTDRPAAQPAVIADPSARWLARGRSQAFTDDFSDGSAVNRPPVPQPTRQYQPPAPVERPAAPRNPGWLASLLTSLMAELSVVWLLFLGVFMVVVSSGVLAATQWANFSGAGQYVILLAYTLVFGAVGLWSSSRPNLQLTSRMLQAATLLLIPVNFWMMDGFNLWKTALGGGIALVAALGLGLLNWKILESKNKLFLANSLGLSALHWGWGIAGVPIGATYLGIIATTAIQGRWGQRQSADETTEPPRFEMASLAIAFSTLLLVGRAVLAKGIPPNRFGLALGIAGGLLYWINRRTRLPLWRMAGGAGLGLGWLLTVVPDSSLAIDPLWQALGITVMALGLLGERWQQWKPVELVIFWLVGLQGYALLRVLFPPNVRASVIALIGQWANLPKGAWELTGLGFFAYVVISLAGAAWLRRQSQPKFAQITEQLALGLGVLGAMPSLFNPLVRAVYLTLSALVLFGVLWRRRSGPEALVYLAHTTGVLALLSWILWIVPQLSALNWAVVFLGLMVVEWLVAGWSRDRAWQRSAFYLGLGTATCSYCCFLASGQLAYRPSAPQASLLWLIAPLMLTGLSRAAIFTAPRLAAGLSFGALALAETLVYPALDPSLVVLGVASALMLLNTQILRHLSAARITVGVMVGFLLTALLKLDSTPIGRSLTQYWGDGRYLLWIGGLVWGLWMARQWLSRGSATDRRSGATGELTGFYAVATSDWGKVLAIGNFLVLSGMLLVKLLSSSDAWYSSAPGLWNTLMVATALTTTAIAYRVWQQPTNLGLLGVTWGVEILVGCSAEIAEAPMNYRAIANLILGLGTQLIGEQWLRKPFRLSINGLPCLYAGLGWLLGHSSFTPTTGLYTLATAAIVLGMSHPLDMTANPGAAATTGHTGRYLSLIGFSVGAYELLIYQLLHSQGGAMGDGIVVLAGLAAVIALGYQIAQRPLRHYFQISPAQLTGVTDLHWTLGSGGIVLALVAGLSTAGLSDLGVWLWSGVTLFLAVYALWQGRNRSELWLYSGIWQTLGAVGYLLWRHLPIGVWDSWAAVLACLGAVVLYFGAGMLGNGEPGRRSAAVLPGLIVTFTAFTINIPALLVTAGFYAWLAQIYLQIRLSYLSVALASWAICRWLAEAQVTEFLWYMAVFSGAVLYVAQVDPALTPTSAKEQRHWLRSFAVGAFSLVAFYQLDGNWLNGLLLVGLGLAGVAAGLTLRVRAYLYVGTLLFLAAVLRQLWLFIGDHSQLLWALGIALGIALIWIAATFESRRSQAVALVQYWLAELEAWA
jgi:hypothetical protein